MEKNKKLVLDFIHHFSWFGQDVIDCFSEGNCYWFAQILNKRFIGSTVMYNPIDNHWACLIKNRLYDISGEISSRGFVDWKDYYISDELEASRLVRDCIAFLPKED